MKSENLPATGKIIRLLEHLSGYYFNLYYVKGKDMILCDYLFRISVDKGDPGEVIPISFNALAQYRLVLDYVAEAFMITHFMVVTRSGTSAAGINLPPVHGAEKGIDPTLKPENQSKSQQTLAKPTPITPGRKVLNPVARWIPSQTPAKSKLKSTPSSTKVTPRSLLNTPVQSQTTMQIKTPSLTSGKQNTTHQQTPVRSQLINKTPISAAQAVSRKLIQKSVKLLNAPKHKPNIKSYPEGTPNIKLLPSNNIPTYTGNESLEVPQLKIPIAPMPKLPPQEDLLSQENPFDINSELIPYQDKEVEAVFKAPELDDFLLPPVLGDQITDSTLMHRYLPKQADIDRIMEQISRKYLTKLQLPCSIRDMQVAYLSSPHFREIYLSVGMNKMPSKAKSAKKLESDLMNAVYMIHGGLLYRYMRNLRGDLDPVLCVPASKIDIFLELFHSCILGGHMGMSKCVLTLQQNFYCPNLAYHVRMCIISCHVCQTFKTHKRFDRPINRWIIDITAPTLTHLSMDIKHMPPSKDKYNYILVILCEISNFIVAVPMKTTTAPEICNALMDSFIGYFSTPIRIVCDQDPAFMSHLTQWFMYTYGIHVTTASPTNHQSLMAEHGIKSLAMLVYNSYATPNLDNLSPFEVAIGRKAVLAPRFEFKSKVPITDTHAKTHEKLQEKLLYSRKG